MPDTQAVIIDETRTFIECEVLQGEEWPGRLQRGESLPKTSTDKSDYQSQRSLA